MNLLASFSRFCLLVLLASSLVHAQSYIPRIDRFTLANGLSVVLQRDTSITDVAVAISFRAGSSFDPEKKKGLATVVGSLYLTPTSTIPAETFQRIQNASSGATTGITDVDAIHITAYYPSEYLETVLWTEADRMRSGGAHFDQSRLSLLIKRLEEQRARTDSRPLFDLNRKTYDELYPDGHPYKTLAGGVVEHISSLTVKDCKSFASRWVVPTNASLTVCGNFDIAQARTWISTYFESIPANKKLKIPVAPPLPPLGQPVLVHEDQIDYTKLMVIFPTVPFGHPDEPQLQLLAKILGGSSNSYLYTLLAEEDPTITAIDAFQSSQAMDGNFWITVTGTLEANLQRVYERIMEVIAVLKRESVLDKDLLEARNAVELAALSQSEEIGGVSGRGFALNRANLLVQNPLLPFTRLEGNATITAPMIQKTLSTYLTPANQMLVSVIPIGKSAQAAKGIK